MRQRQTGNCSVEGCERPSKSLGLCGAHYQMRRKYGRTEKTKRDRTGACIVAGCERPDDGGNGLCRVHYARQYHHGHTDLVREGDKRKHPKYALWFDRKTQGVLCERWLNLKSFAADIGEKPGPDHYLIRLDITQPFGPDNFKWQPHLRRAEGESRKDWWARKWASRRDADPGMERRREMRRKYGITVDEYEEMLKRSAGLCEICRRPETSFDPKTGAFKRLAVDHDHETGKVRGLLCWSCNSALGRLNEDVERLESMIAYIQKHKAPDAP